MSNYYVHRSGEDEYLEHAFLGFSAKGGTVHNRSGSYKYLAKFNVGGRTRYIYDPRELAAFKAGGRALGNARNAVGGAMANVRRAGGKASRFIDRNITGASAKRRMNINQKRYERLDRSQKRSDNTLGNMAQKRAQKYQKQYNQSLFGRIENAGKRIANVGNSARTAVGNAAGQAAKAGKNFAGSVTKEAYRTARKTKRKVKGLITPKKAPRKPAKEVNVRDYAKIDRKNEKSAEQYQYFDKDAGWATNSLAAAKRLSGHKSHNRQHAARNRKRGRNAISRSTR